MTFVKFLLTYGKDKFLTTVAANQSLITKCHVSLNSGIYVLNVFACTALLQQMILFEHQRTAYTTSLSISYILLQKHYSLGLFWKFRQNWLPLHFFSSVSVARYCDST